MPHVLYRATIALHTPLGTPLAGDTLFGQLCWTLRETQGEAELTRRLDAYTSGQPWLVVSDGFPAGFLPKPTVPPRFEPQPTDPAQRKIARKKRWIPVDTSAGDGFGITHGSPAQLLSRAVDETTAFGEGRQPKAAVQFHNTINRLTGTTGQGRFAPYAQSLIFYTTGQRIDLYLVLDDTRGTAQELSGWLAAMGATGYGRDASVGLGKFTVETLTPVTQTVPADANAWWTLAACAPQGQGFDGRRSYWRVLTRFGRHGNTHALGGKPFKNPVLMAATGAVLRPLSAFSPRLFVGQGLGGGGLLSKAEPATVHQGYAPALAIAWKDAA